jgi:hypothetical protein
MGPGYWVVALSFPAILVTATAFPVFAVTRYVVLRRHGEGTAHRTMERIARRVWIALIVCVYAVTLLVLLRPGALPGFTRFILRGGLAVLVPAIFLDYAMGLLLSPARALAVRRRERPNAAP